MGVKQEVEANPTVKTISSFCKAKTVSSELLEAFKIYLIDIVKEQLKIEGSKRFIRTKLCKIPIYGIDKYFACFLEKIKFEIEILERD